MINIHEAETDLSRLMEAAAKGEAFIIAKAGKVMVKVVPLGPETPRKIQRLGSWKVSSKFQMTLRRRSRRIVRKCSVCEAFA